MADYRFAVVADAIEIARVLMSVWPDDKADAGRIAGAIVRPDHKTIVAVDDSRVIGFVDGFRTVSERGERRLEVDLLAVDPAYQGQGIGRELVRRLTEIGTDADFARALIRIGNFGSERAFAACGYQTDETTMMLFVATSKGQRTYSAVNGLHLVPVETFSYSGKWLEGKQTRGSLRFARHLVVDGIVGAVIPTADVPALEPETAGYERIGEYRWWQHDYIGRC